MTAATACTTSRSITATAGTTGACKIVTYDDAAGGWVPNESGPIEIPVGATVNVTELLGGYPYVSGDGNPAGQDDNQSTTVVNGINTVSFHNQALGQLEICKAMLVDHKNGVDDSNFNNIAIFHFSIDGATSGPLSDVQVAAGHCSMPLIVNVGQHTIRENLARTTVNGKTITLGFAFVSATATGPTGDNRVVTSGNPVTVSVPYFADPANGGETLVTITNRVLRAQIKVCKVVEPGSVTPLAGDTWQYSAVSLQALTSATPNQTATNGTCTGLIVPGDPSQSAGWQIIDTSGSPIDLIVVETTFSGPGLWVIQDASVDNPYPGTPTSLKANTFLWSPGPGVNVVTITNKYATG